MLGRGCGVYGNGAANRWESDCGQPIDVAPDPQGQFIITYQYWVDFLGIPAYRAYVNGIDVWPGAGWQLNSVTWTANVSSDQKYDCINGGCVPAITYDTPGFYANLAACQSGCAKNSTCKGECVEAAEIAALEQAVNNLKPRICG
jgi:hypothetical protein